MTNPTPLLRWPALAAALAIASSTGCAFFSPAAPHKPVHHTEAPSPHGAERFPNWPMPPAVTYEDLAFGEDLRGEYEIISYGGAGAGTTGAEERVVALPGLGADVKFKVKLVPGDLDGINNAPRKELAAYLIQHLFLDPEDFVVPTTFVFCISMETWREVHGGKGDPNVDGLDCALVIDALWLKDVTVPDVLYDEERFLTDATYAYFLSNLNVLTYVINHRDGRQGNFLVSTNDARRQVFIVDNGSTFNIWGYNYFVANWDVIRTAAVRQETIDRLRKISRDDLDFLLVVAQLEVDGDGFARQVPPGPSLDDDKGALYEGNTIQFGLTQKEIHKVWKRIQVLIQQVDDGELPVF